MDGIEGGDDDELNKGETVGSGRTVCMFCSLKTHEPCVIYVLFTTSRLD